MTLTQAPLDGQRVLTPLRSWSGSEGKESSENQAHANWIPKDWKVSRKVLVKDKIPKKVQV